MTVENFEKIINSLSYCMNFNIPLVQEELKLFLTYWGEFENKLTDKYRSLGKDILRFTQK